MIQKNCHSQFGIGLEIKITEEQNISKSWYFAIPSTNFLSMAGQYWEKVYQTDW